jgi:hypothetical protein
MSNAMKPIELAKWYTFLENKGFSRVANEGIMTIFKHKEKFKNTNYNFYFLINGIENEATGYLSRNTYEEMEIPSKIIKMRGELIDRNFLEINYNEVINILNSRI